MKDSSNGLKKVLKLLSINLGEGYKAIYKQSEVHYSTERTIIHKRETFKTAANLPRSGSRSKLNPRSDYPMLIETGKKPQKLHPNSTGLSWCVKC